MVALRLLESGNRGGRAARAKRPLSAYNRFVREFSQEHPGMEGPTLIRRAAAAYREDTGMAANPGHRGEHKHASHDYWHDRSTEHHRRRNPGSGSSANPYENPVANPGKRGGKRRGKRNPMVPASVNRALDNAYGVTLEQGAAGTVAFLATELGGQYVQEFIAVPLGLATKAPDGSLVPIARPAHADGKPKFDFMYTAKVLVPRVISGGAVYWLSKLFGLKGDNRLAVGVGAAAAVGSQAVAVSTLAEPYVHSASLHVDSQPAIRPPMPPLPLGPGSSDRAFTDDNAKVQMRTM